MRQTSLSHKAVGSSSSSSVHMRTARRRCAVAAKASTQNDDSSVHRQSSARLPARRRCAVIAKAASPNDGSSVHNGRLPFLEQLKQFVSPQQYARMTLNGHKLAWGKTGLPGKDTLFLADVDAARAIMSNELQLGVGGDWPNTVQAMMGHSAISMTTDLDLHSRLRQYLGAAFTQKEVEKQLGQLQDTAATHLARWAAATTATSSSNRSSSNGSGSNGAAAASANSMLSTTADGSMVMGYGAVRMLTFDVLVNRVLGLGMSDGEVQQYAQLFQTLVDGFVPPAWDVPFTMFGKGLKARELLTERIKQTLRSPQCTGALARLRDEFGVDSPVTIDNTVTLLFAGFDTTSSSITYMLWLLASHPHVLDKVHEEQAAVMSKYGTTLTPEAYKAMSYTTAVVKETLRLAQVVAYVPRMATKPLDIPNGGPTLPSGCPFIVALASISAADPALHKNSSSSSSEGVVEQFEPERWLDPAAAKSLATHQLPFGTGQRTCLGMNLAYAEMVAVLAELGRSYTLSAQCDTDWSDFPIKRPGNGLPIRLQGRSRGQNGGVAAAGAGANATVATGV